jgi:hypothetical protein
LVKQHNDIYYDVNDIHYDENDGLVVHYDDACNVGYYDAYNNCYGGNAYNFYDRDNDDMGDSGSSRNGVSQTPSQQESGVQQ